MLLLPGLLLERIAFTPFNLLSAPSKGAVNCASTAAGEALFQMLIREIVLVTTFGLSFFGSCV